jgi:hypothetical protein
MKLIKLIGLTLILSVFFLTGFVNSAESDEMLVRVNVLETEISITVPDEVVFEDIAQGYLSERQELEIINVGTVDVDVSLDLDESYNETIFENLAFRRILTDPLVNIIYFSFEIEKPEIVGGERIEDVYMYLDLTNYEEEITSTIIDHNTTVIFTAVPL